MKFNLLKKTDKQLYQLVEQELKRQKQTIDLIASENFVPEAIFEVLGSPLTNKYSEGYPHKRYYPGNVYYDEIEELAQQRALQAFKLDPKKWAVNVQPYSGSPANLEVYNALLQPGDVFMGMSLTSGGHLTHGHKANLSGKLYKSIQYNLNPKTELIDYQEIEDLANKYHPKIIVSGLTSYPRNIDFEKISQIAHLIGAYSMADISHIAGLVLAGLSPNPFNSCDIVMTTIHKTLRGPRGAIIFINKESEIAKKNQIDLEGAINKSVFPQMQGGPHNNVTAAIALTFKLAQSASFRNYQKQIIKNSRILAQELKKIGFRLVTNGTDNHLMILDLRNLGISGMEAETLLDQAGIVANRNVVVGDMSPFHPSGIRIGVPAVTTRGMKEKEMKKIAEFIYLVLIKKEKPVIIKREVEKLCKKFPIY
ncbi:MAG: serine hydroxymethyltransferase [Parcubacteria group bacterium]|nr:serine hydroxymethyltransferase [Parcubacteria group bacterium]